MLGLMTPERAREVLKRANLGREPGKQLSAQEIGECRKHMSTDEIEEVFAIRQLTGPASTFLEVIKLIAAKQIK